MGLFVSMNDSLPLQHIAPSTVASASTTMSGPFLPVMVERVTTVSPGRTCRLKRTLSIPA